MSQELDERTLKKIQDLVVDPYLFDSVMVVPELISEEFVRIAPDIAYWSSHYARAHQDYLTAKLNTKRVRAGFRISERARLIGDGVKYTESMLDALVDASDTVFAAEAAEIAAEVERSRIMGILEAVRAKKDMLVSIGAHQRAEMSAHLAGQMRAGARASGENAEHPRQLLLHPCACP